MIIDVLLAVADETDSLDQSTNDIPDDATNNHDSSSGYHSNQEDSQPPSSQVSALELENKLLKNEVASLNDEMRSVIQRAKDAQTGRCPPPFWLLQINKEVFT